ncbi:MAG: polysaccharide biosynthesis tyrosine autokinase [Bacteroidales bacterium]|nr:polysaccharide biosynthesis tyrosine autokinase [Bacteroidales bacterium]
MIQKISKFNDEFDFKLFTYIAKRNLKWIILFFLSLFLLLFIYLRYTQPIYESSTIVQLNSDDKAQKLFETKNLYDEDIYQKIEIMRSSVFIRRVLSHLPLDVSIFAKGQILNFELYKSAPFTIQYEILDSSFFGQSMELTVHEDHLSLNYPSIDGRIQEVSFQPYESLILPQLALSIAPNDTAGFMQTMNNEEFIIVFNNLDNLVDQYSRKVNISVVNDVAKTIRISIKDINASKASDIVNAITAEFEAFEIEQQKESSESILEFIDGQLGIVEENLNDSEDSLQKVSVSNPDTIQDKSGLKTRLMELDRLISKSKYEKDALTSFIESVEDENNDVLFLISMLTGTESYTYLSPYLNSLQELEFKRNEYLLTMTESSSVIEGLDQQILYHKKMIRQSASSLLKKLNSDMHQQVVERNKIASILGQRMIDIPDDQSRLERYYSVNEKFYNQLIEKKIEYSIAIAGYVSQLIVLEPARPNFVPVFPNKKMIWLGGFAFAFLLSLGFIILKYLLYNEVVSLKDVTRYTAVPVLGVIPKYKSYIPVSQLIVDTRPRSLLAESLRAIRTNLQFIKNGSTPKTISITSTVSGEGKTFVAINLAGVLAFSEENVIVLDFDMRKPKIHLGFNTDNEKGVSSILAGHEEIDNCIRKSALANLDFITAGPEPINPSELILGEKMNEMLEYLRGKYAYVIIDTPPIGLVSDAMKCLQNADYPIYVIRANFSERNFIYNVERLYNENNFRYLSVILNNVDPDITGAGSSRGYAYGYGYGYGHDRYGYYEEEQYRRKGFFGKFARLFSRKHA